MSRLGMTRDNLVKHNQSSSETNTTEERNESGGNDVYNYGISTGNMPPMMAPLSARSITDCDSLFEEMLRGGSIFSPMAGSLSGGTPYGFASTSGLNGNIIANAAGKDKKEVFEEFASPTGRPGKLSAQSSLDCPPPTGLMRGGSSSRSARSGGSNSPTSRAMNMIKPMITEYDKILLQDRIAKRQQETKSQVHSVDEIIPLQMLPYFRWLNDAAQRSLLKQLIERFQRTSYTPRYASIATPVHGMTSGLGDKSSNQDTDLDPSCFDKLDPQAKSTKSDGDTKIKTEKNAQKSGEGEDTSIDNMPSPSKAPTVRTGSSTTSLFDDAAIEAAVAVAMQLASQSSSSEQILQILTGNTNSNSGGDSGGGSNITTV